MSTRRQGRRPGAVATCAQAVGTFYRRPMAWVALLVSSLLLTFGGGAVMFWFHTILRGEQGPVIGDLHHWLDSSLGRVWKFRPAASACHRAENNLYQQRPLGLLVGAGGTGSWQEDNDD